MPRSLPPFADEDDDEEDDEEDGVRCAWWLANAVPSSCCGACTDPLSASRCNRARSSPPATPLLFPLCGCDGPNPRPATRAPLSSGTTTPGGADDADAEAEADGSALYVSD